MTTRRVGRTRGIRMLGIALALNCYTFATAHGAIVSPVAKATNGQRMVLNWGQTAMAVDDIFTTVEGAAGARVQGIQPLLKTDSKLKFPVLNSGDTTLATRSFGGTTAEARAKWTSTNDRDNKKEFTLRADGTFAEVNNPRGVLGNAQAQVVDPFIFTEAAGETFDFAYGLASSTGGFSIQAVGAGMLAEAFTMAGSDIPGFETFFTLYIAVKGSDPTTLIVDFDGNDALGFDDSMEAIVEADISAHLPFNASDSSFTLLDPEFDFASFSVTVPTGQDRVAFSWSTTASASAVPEPSALMLWGIVAIGIVAYGLRRKRVAVA